MIEDKDLIQSLPMALDAEESILGSILIDSTVVNEVVNIVTEDDFYRDKNQWIMAAVRRLHAKGEPCHQVSVARELGSRLSDIGGSDYLSYLVQNVASSVHAAHYSHMVKKMSRKRDIISAMDGFSAMAYETDDPDEVLAGAMQKILEMKQEKAGGLTLIGDYALDYKSEFDTWLDSGCQATGVLTGFTDLDRILNGLKGGQVISVFGRPSMGKSIVLLRMAKNCAARGDTPALFSLEMSKRELLHRLIFSEARVNEEIIRTSGFDSLGIRERVDEKYSQIMELPMWIDDSPSVKTQSAQAKMINIMARTDIKIMFFDHMTLSGNTVKGGNEVQRIGDIMRGLKAIAKICNIPVVVAIQLGRDVSKTRTNHRPMLEDGRGSGDIEQDSDVVLGLYRDEYYHPYGTSDYKSEHRNHLEVSVLKQRMGKANPRGGMITGLFYEGHTGYIGDWAGNMPSTR